MFVESGMGTGGLEMEIDAKAAFTMIGTRAITVTSFAAAVRPGVLFH